MASPNLQRKRDFEEAAITDNHDGVTPNNTFEDEFEKAWKRAKHHGKSREDAIPIDDDDIEPPPISKVEINQNAPNKDDFNAPLMSQTLNRSVQSGLRILDTQKVVPDLQSRTPFDPSPVQNQGEKQPIDASFDQNLSRDARLGDPPHPNQPVSKRQKRKVQEQHSFAAKKQKLEQKISRKQKSQMLQETGFKIKGIRYTFPKLLDDNNQEIALQLQPFNTTDFSEVFLPAFLEENKAVLETMDDRLPLQAFVHFMRWVKVYAKYHSVQKRHVKKELVAAGIVALCKRRIAHALNIYNLEKKIQEMKPGEELAKFKQELDSLKESAKESSKNPAHPSVAFQLEQHTNPEHDDHTTIDTDSDVEELHEATNLLSSSSGKSPGQNPRNSDAPGDKMTSHNHGGIPQSSDQILSAQSAEPQTFNDSSVQDKSFSIEIDTSALNSSIPSAAGLPNTVSDDATGSPRRISVRSGSPITSTEVHNGTGETQNLHTDSVEMEMDIDASEVELIDRYYPGSKNSTSVPRCLACAEVRHGTSKCSSLTCSICGIVGAHFTSGCPRTQRCTRCFKCGHGKNDCSEKLAATVDERPSCDLCTSNKHLAPECDLMWRSYKPHFIKVKLSVKHIPIYCYRCANEGHYGPDCNRNLSSTSYTWTKNNWRQYIDPKSNQCSISACKEDSFPIPTRPKGFFIKGNASKNSSGHDVIDLEDDTPFIGRKVTRPPPRAPQGKQHIRLRNSGNDTYTQRSQGPPNIPPVPGSRNFLPRSPLPRDRRNDLGRPYGREPSISPPPMHPSDRFEPRSRGYSLRSDDSYNHRGSGPGSQIQGRQSGDRGGSFGRGRGGHGRPGNPNR